MLVPATGAAFAGLVQGNKTLGDVLELLKEDTDRDKIIAGLKAKYDAPEGVIERDVDRVINELKKIGALEE